MKTLHTPQTSIFNRAYAQNKMHHAWLISGPKGVGKATWARARAAELLEVSQEHLEYHTHFLGLGSREVSLSIDQLRDAKAFFTHIPLEDKPKIVLLDNLDGVNEKTINALLKILEEPPARTIFLLVTHQPHLLLPTVNSRTIRLRFNLLSDEETKSIVCKHVAEIDSDAFDMAEDLYRGQPGKIIEFLEKDRMALVRKFQILIEKEEDIEFEKEKETKDAFYLLAKLIHRKRSEEGESYQLKNIFEITQNRIIHDSFLYNLDKKTSMISMLNFL